MNNNKNCWYCEKCKFYVFNSKSKCKKCFTNKPQTVQYTKACD